MQTEGNTKNTLQIDPEFRSLLPTLTTEESAALEESIEREGCRDALIVWGDTLVDGHNRHEICTRRGFPFEVRQMDFDSREDVIIWICANQNARRNITPEQKAYLVGKRMEAEKSKLGGNRKSKPHDEALIEEKGKTSARIAKEIGVARATVERAAQYARAVDTLAADSPTIKRKILSGEIKLPRATIVEIAAKPEAERKAAVDRMERGDHPITDTMDALYSGDNVPVYCVAGGALNKAYRQWADSNGEYARRTQDFAQALEAAGFTRRKTMHGRYWDGLKLIPQQSAYAYQSS